MASGAFMDGKTALLVAPLVSSTASLVCAWDQHAFLSFFARPETREHSNALLPGYWRVSLARGVTQVVCQVGVTTWASVGAVVAHRRLLERRGALPWYAAAAALATGHLLFVPLVAGRIRSIMDDEDGGTRAHADTQREWLGVNMVRMLTVDLGAWVCALVAVTKTLAVD